MTASIRDVAREAGVSVTTISRVLNDTGPVAADTRQRALAAIERLGYVPHRGARSLITRKTETVGVVLPDVFGEFFSELIRGIDQTARCSHHHVLVSSSHSDLDELQAVLHALRGRVDGLIVMSPDVECPALPAALRPHAADPPAQLRRRIATASTRSRSTTTAAPAPWSAIWSGLGHRRIAMIGGPADNLDARERARGWRDAMAAAGYPVAPELSAARRFPRGIGLRGRPCAGRRSPSVRRAVFAANDAMAVGCLSAFRELGWRVPEDVAIGGFDDIPIARYLNPPLTSVRVPIAELGARAMQRLLARLADRRRGAPSP